MSGAFTLKKPLGRSYNVDLGDVRRTKQALHGLGFYKMPSYGLTDYPDEPLFSGIEDFQQKYGLQRDGFMRPGGETERTLRALTGTTADEKSAAFVSTVAIVDAAVAVSAVVVVDVAVAGAGPDGFGSGRRGRF